MGKSRAQTVWTSGLVLLCGLSLRAAVASQAPAEPLGRDLGVVVFANAGGERAAAASTEAVKALVQRFSTP